MVSRTFKVGQAFGKRGVLSKATQAAPETFGDRDDFAPFWATGDSAGGLFLDRPTFSQSQTITGGNSAAARVTNRITLSPVARDPEGFPLTYSVDTIPANPTQLDSVSVTGNAFRFTPAYGLLGDSQNNAGSFKARLRASDGVRDVLDVVTFTVSYTEDMHVPSGTTLLLGLSFTGGAMGKSGSWGTPSLLTGAPTYNASGGVLNNGYASAWSSTKAFSVSELSVASSGRGKTFIAWYKGTQTNGTNSAYSPGVPVFGHNTGSVWAGFGMEDGYIAVCGGGSATKGTTLLNNDQWRMLAFVYPTDDDIDGYVDVNGTMTKEINGKDITSSSGNNYINIIGYGYPYGGYASPTALDNVQIFDNILTQSQIQAIFDKGGGTNGGN